MALQDDLGTYGARCGAVLWRRQASGSGSQSCVNGTVRAGPEVEPVLVALIARQIASDGSQWLCRVLEEGAAGALGPVDNGETGPASEQPMESGGRWRRRPAPVSVVELVQQLRNEALGRWSGWIDVRCWCFLNKRRWSDDRSCRGCCWWRRRRKHGLHGWLAGTASHCRCGSRSRRAGRPGD